MFSLEQNQIATPCGVSDKTWGPKMNNRFLLIAGAASALALVGSSVQAGVVNGNFEAGNTGFTSGYTFLPGNGVPEGVYDVGVNPNAIHSSWATFGDHTSGAGNMMIVNGATAAGVNVWSETGLTVLSSTTYFFSTWVRSTYDASPAMLDFSVNGSVIGSLTAGLISDGWQQFYGTWTSGAATTLADLALVNNNTAFSGNDFALDDIAFGLTRPGVPEPSTWALMLMGFGAIGYAVRRQRAFVKAA